MKFEIWRIINSPLLLDVHICIFGQSYDVEVKVEVILVTRFSYMDYLFYNLMSDYILTSIKIYNITY